MLFYRKFSSFSFFALVFPVAFLTGVNAHAGLIRSPFLINASALEAKKFIVTGYSSESLINSDVINIEDRNYSGIVNVDLSGIHLTLNTSFAPPVYDEQADDIKFNSTSVSANLLVDKIHVHQEVEQDVAGGRIKVIFDGTCTDARLELPSLKKAQVKAKLNLDFVNGKPKISIKSFEPKWEPGSWQVISMNCAGPVGLPEQMRIAAEENLKSIDPFKNEIQKRLEDKLEAWTTKPMIFKLKKDSEERQVTLLGQPVSLLMTVTEINQLDSKMVSAKGIGDFEFGGDKNRNQGCDADFSGKEFSVADSWQKGNAMFLPYDTMRALITCLSKNGNLNFNVLGTEIDGFEKFRKKRSDVLTAWPDLYQQEGKNFLFESEFTDTPKMTKETFHENLTMTAFVEAPLATTMQLPKKYYFIPYMHFSSKFAGFVNFRIRKGMLTAMPGEKMKLSIVPKWDEVYVRRYQPDRTLLWDYLLPGIKKGMLEDGFSFNLPVIQPFKNKKTQISFTDGAFLGSAVRLGLEFSK